MRLFIPAGGQITNIVVLHLTLLSTSPCFLHVVNCARPMYHDRYPYTVPNGTAIPRWAFQDPTKSDMFDLVLAKSQGGLDPNIFPRFFVLRFVFRSKQFTSAYWQMYQNKNLAQLLLQSPCRARSLPIGRPSLVVRASSNFAVKLLYPQLRCCWRCGFLCCYHSTRMFHLQRQRQKVRSF